MSVVNRLGILFSSLQMVVNYRVFLKTTSRLSFDAVLSGVVSCLNNRPFADLCHYAWCGIAYRFSV